MSKAFNMNKTFTPSIKKVTFSDAKVGDQDLRKLKMKNVNLNDLKIDFVEYCLNDGFFFVVFENGKSVQCCLASLDVIDPMGYSHSIYQVSIKEDENGFDEGISRDCNRWASHDDECEWDHINEFLIDQARKEGLEII